MLPTHTNADRARGVTVGVAGRTGDWKCGDFTSPKCPATSGRAEMGRQASGPVLMR